MQAEDIRQSDEVTDKPQRSTHGAAPTHSTGFLDRLFSFLSGTTNQEAERRRLFRDVTRMLKSTRYKFYKTRTEEVLPALAKFFYDLYTIVGPAQLLLDHADSSGVLKSIIVERFFSPEEAALRAAISEESIKERATETDPPGLAEEVKEKLTSLLAGFDQTRVREINSLYNLLKTFLDAVHFDYYFLLKKFDTNLPERDFRYQPHFDSIHAEYLLEDLKDFLSLIYLIDSKASWELLLDVLREYRGVDIIKSSDWSKYLRLALDVRRSRVLELIVQHSSKDPRFRVKILAPNEKIVEAYLTKLRSQAEITVQKLAREKHTQKIDSLATALFGTSAVERTKNYTDKYSTLFTQRMLGGFTHVAALNYLMAFLNDYIKKDFREIVDLLIVRGKWSTPLMSQQLSESFHVLLAVSDELAAFDASLADEADLGIRLKGLLWKTERERVLVKSLRQLVKETNESAIGMIVRAAQNLVIMGKSFKIVLEDYDKKNRELLSNWKEVEAASKGDFRAKVVEAYKKIYFFIQLLQMFVKKEPG